MATTIGGAVKAPPLTEPFSMEAAALHARLPAHRRLVARTISRIQEALALHPGEWAAGCSGGKDSTALLSIALAAGWRGPVFHFAFRGDYDHEPTEMARGLAERHDLPFATVEVMSEMEAITAVGADFNAPGERGQEGFSKASRLWERTYKRELEVFQRSTGWTGILMGMRAEESHARRLMLRQKGCLYQVKNRPGWTCCPLYDWSGRDVWAAIASSGLPWLSRYDCAGDRIRERSDDAWFAPQVGQGSWGERLRRRDPGMWHSLDRRFPGLRLEP